MHSFKVSSIRYKVSSILTVLYLLICLNSSYSNNKSHHSNLKYQFTTDAGVKSIATPVSGNNLNYYEPVTVVVFNYGTNDIENVPVSYTVNNGTVFTDTIKNTIFSNDSIIYTFSYHANLSVTGSYQFKAFTSLQGDQNYANDTAYSTVYNIQNSYCNSSSENGYVENIGLVKIGDFTNGSATPLYHNSLCDKNYVNFTGSLPAIRLVPDSSYQIDISQIVAGSIFNSCFINVYIDYNQDGKFDYYTERVFGQMTFEGDSIVQGTIKINNNAKGGYTRMRIVMDEGADASTALPCNFYNWGETQDYAVLIDPLIPQDAGVVNILQPAAVEGEDNSIQVKVVIKNFGSEIINKMDVSYALNSGIPVVYNWTGQLKPNATDTILMSSFVVPAFDNNICAYTTLTGDTNYFNDEFCKTFYGYSQKSDCRGFPQSHRSRVIVFQHHSL